MNIHTLFYSLLFVFGFFCVSTMAQTMSKAHPYSVGENLIYEVKFSKAVVRGIDIADLNFAVEVSPDSQNYVVKSEAKSKGLFPKLLNFKFNQNIQSTVDGEKWQVLKTVKRDEQDERVRDSEAIFDYRTKKVIYTETDPNDSARPPRSVASAIENGTQDLITAIYMLRRLPLAVGKTFELKISDSGLAYEIPVRVTRRELQKSVSGKVWCFRVEPEVFGKNRLIEKQGSMIIWIADDVLRLPVRAQINSDIGKMEARLKEAKIVR